MFSYAPSVHHTVSCGLFVAITLEYIPEYMYRSRASISRQSQKVFVGHGLRPCRSHAKILEQKKNKNNKFMQTKRFYNALWMKLIENSLKRFRSLVRNMYLFIGQFIIRLQVTVHYLPFESIYEHIYFHSWYELCILFK